MLGMFFINALRKFFKYFSCLPLPRPAAHHRAHTPSVSKINNRREPQGGKAIIALATKERKKIPRAQRNDEFSHIKMMMKHISSHVMKEDEARESREEKVINCNYTTGERRDESSPLVFSR
jgi:hypothetical protein